MIERITTGGLAMPKLGLGTWGMSGRSVSGRRRERARARLSAYRHGADVRERGRDRPRDRGERACRAPTSTSPPRSGGQISRRKRCGARCEQSLGALRTDYVDLYLIHWPAPDMDLPRALEALMALQQEGRARAIGVSNFPTALLRRAVEEAQAPLACDQVEYHVLLDQSRVLGYARPHGIAVTAYAPLAKGQLADSKELAGIARKHGATPAQVALKWLMDQDGVAAIPKAARVESQRANLDALQLQLDDEDRAAIARLPKDQRFVNPTFAPQWDDAR